MLHNCTGIFDILVQFFPSKLVKCVLPEGVKQYPDYLVKWRYLQFEADETRLNTNLISNQIQSLLSFKHTHTHTLKYMHIISIGDMQRLMHICISICWRWCVSKRGEMRSEGRIQRKCVNNNKSLPKSTSVNPLAQNKRTLWSHHYLMCHNNFLPPSASP